MTWPARHGWTPGRFDGRCRVRLARSFCPWAREEHDPSLPPADVDAYGRVRGVDHHHR